MKHLLKGWMQRFSRNRHVENIDFPNTHLGKVARGWCAWEKVSMIFNHCVQFFNNCTLLMMDHLIVFTIQLIFMLPCQNFWTGSSSKVLCTHGKWRRSRTPWVRQSSACVVWDSERLLFLGVRKSASVSFHYHPAGKFWSWKWCCMAPCDVRRLAFAHHTSVCVSLLT